jgi:hypothetical protein
MSDGGDSVEIENKVEGPQQKVEIHLSAKDYLNQGYPTHSAFNQNGWAYEQISEHLPPGKLKKAFDLAKNERDARIKANVDVLSNESMVPGSDEYAFRVFKRKSDGSPLRGNEKATLSSVGDNLYEYGIEAPGDEDMILPRNIWDPWGFPTITGMRDRGEDVTGILVYENKPFVLPTKESDEHVTLIDLETAKKVQISKKEAADKKYPTLRDLFVGQIEVFFDGADSINYFDYE